MSITLAVPESVAGRVPDSSANACYWLCSYGLGPGTTVLPGNWGRLIRKFGATSHPRCGLAAKEYIFEAVRGKYFPQHPSRLECAFVMRDLKPLREFRNEQRRTMDRIYQIEPVDPTSRTFHGSLDLATITGSETVKDIQTRAHLYWTGLPRGPLEILIEGPIRILREVA